jgi:Fur family transcriptional regulator, peroxide stress response regulator
MVAMNNINQIVKALKDKGLRVTPQRYALYANLLERSDHPTAEQLLLDLNGAGPRSSQATVYSSLLALREVGLVREVLLESGVCRYDAKVDRHHHFRCSCCGRIEDIAWESLAPVNLSQMPSHLQVDQYEVIVQGHCGDCKD